MIQFSVLDCVIFSVPRLPVFFSPPGKLCRRHYNAGQAIRTALPNISRVVIMGLSAVLEPCPSSRFPAGFASV